MSISSVVGVAAACPRRMHRLERREPYDGKLSSTVLRGAWAGNRPRLPGGSCWVLGTVWCRLEGISGQVAQFLWSQVGSGGFSETWETGDNSGAVRRTRQYQGTTCFPPLVYRRATITLKIAKHPESAPQVAQPQSVMLSTSGMHGAFAMVPPGCRRLETQRRPHLHFSAPIAS